LGTVLEKGFREMLEKGASHIDIKGKGLREYLDKIVIVI